MRKPNQLIAAALMIGVVNLTGVPVATGSDSSVALSWCNTMTGVFHPRPYLVELPTYNGNSDCIMGPGAQGAHVRALQNSLRLCNKQDVGTVDGIYGTRTRNAVVAVQRAAGIPDDGVYGPQTRGAMLWLHRSVSGQLPFCGPI